MLLLSSSVAVKNYSLSVQKHFYAVIRCLRMSGFEWQKFFIFTDVSPNVFLYVAGCIGLMLTDFKNISQKTFLNKDVFICSLSLTCIRGNFRLSQIREGRVEKVSFFSALTCCLESIED